MREASQWHSTLRQIGSHGSVLTRFNCPIRRPRDLSRVSVRRQHIIDHELASRANRPRDLFADPGRLVETTTPTIEPTLASARTDTCPGIATFRSPPATESARAGDLVSVDDLASSIFSETAEADVADVQRQNTSLHKRQRVAYDNSQVARDGPGQDRSERTGVSDGSDQRGAGFRPSELERRVHDAIVHPRHHGKHPQTLLESAQQSLYVRFLASPPVLRGLYTFAFGLGLSVMHLRRVTTWDRMEASERGANLIDYSTKNALRPAPAITALNELVEAVQALHSFALHFYNDDVIEFIEAAVEFVSHYGDLVTPDDATCRLLVYWLNSKFSRFRSIVVSDGLAHAIKVKEELNRRDDTLAALQEYRQARSPALLTTRRANAPEQPRRGEKTERQPVPPHILAALPREGSKSVCMRFLSKAGCPVAVCARAHFRPASLPAAVKSYITERWNGLDSKFSDL
jgi:hypothetical protein